MEAPAEPSEVAVAEVAEVAEAEVAEASVAEEVMEPAVAAVEEPAAAQGEESEGVVTEDGTALDKSRPGSTTEAVPELNLPPTSGSGSPQEVGEFVSELPADLPVLMLMGGRVTPAVVLTDGPPRATLSGQGSRSVPVSRQSRRVLLMQPKSMPGSALRRGGSSGAGVEQGSALSSAGSLLPMALDVAALMNPKMAADTPDSPTPATTAPPSAALQREATLSANLPREATLSVGLTKEVSEILHNAVAEESPAPEASVSRQDTGVVEDPAQKTTEINASEAAQVGQNDGQAQDAGAGKTDATSESTTADPTAVKQSDDVKTETPQTVTETTAVTSETAEARAETSGGQTKPAENQEEKVNEEGLTAAQVCVCGV